MSRTLPDLWPHLQRQLFPVLAEELGPLSKPRMVFPMEVPKGTVIVKIHRVRNKAYLVRTKDETLEEKERFRFKVSFFAAGKRRQKMFAGFEEAHAGAKSKADQLAAGPSDAVAMSNKESTTCVHAAEALKPAGMPLELAGKAYAEAWKALGGKASVIKAAKEFAAERANATASSPKARPTCSTTPPAKSPAAANSASTRRRKFPAKASNARGRP